MLRFGAEPARDGGFFPRQYPFRRSWAAILIVLAMDVVFLFPAISTFQQISGSTGRFESLFDLVIVLFLGGWLIGWSIAPLGLTALLLVLLFGRETVSAGPGTLETSIGLPLIRLAWKYDVSRMRNLRIVEPPPRSGKAWRGPHMVFDYDSREVALGSNVEPGELGTFETQLAMLSGKKPRKGEFAPEEQQRKWQTEPEAVPEAAIEKPLVGEMPETRISASILMLVAANLVPVAGALFLGWNLSDVMVLYWAESAIIGLFNVAKIAVVGRWMALLAGPFFVGHFGAFMAVHFLFIYTIFVEGFFGSGPKGDLAEVAALFAGLWPALLALTLSHGFSFFANFIGRSEYRGRTIEKQMNEPYGRIVFMHLVLIFGGGLAMVLGGPTIVIVIVIVLKVVFDIRAHLRQRARFAASTGR